MNAELLRRMNAVMAALRESSAWPNVRVSCTPVAGLDFGPLTRGAPGYDVRDEVDISLHLDVHPDHEDRVWRGFAPCVWTVAYCGHRLHVERFRPREFAIACMTELLEMLDDMGEDIAVGKRGLLERQFRALCLRFNLCYQPRRRFWLAGR